MWPHPKMDKLKRFLSGRSKWTRVPTETDEDFQLISNAEQENVEPTQMKAKENVLTALKPVKPVKLVEEAKLSGPTKKDKLIDDEVPLINL